MNSVREEHPYFPRDIIVPGYVKNNISNVSLLSTFFGVISIILVLLYKYTSQLDHLSHCFVTRIKICWFCMCGFTHLFLEGYYFLKFRTIASDESFFGEMWKEYSLSDSRYITGDSFIVCMEGVTAFVDGPLAFYALHLFLKNKSTAYIIQLVLSLCQLYGDTLYFLTEYKDDFMHGPYNHPVYFWFYFFFMNLLWIVIPFMCIIEAYIVLSKCTHQTFNCMKKD